MRLLAGRQLLALSAVLGVLLVRPAHSGQRLVMSGDGIIETAGAGGGGDVPQPQMGLGHSSLLWSCPPGMMGSPTGCVDRPKEKEKQPLHHLARLTPSEVDRNRRETLTKNRVLNEYLQANLGGGRATVEVAKEAMAESEGYLEEHGVDPDLDIGWTERDEPAHRTGFEHMKNQLQGKLDASSAKLEAMDADVDAVLLKTKEMEAVIDPIIKQAQNAKTDGDVDQDQVALMRQLVQMVCAPRPSFLSFVSLSACVCACLRVTSRADTWPMHAPGCRRCAG